MRKQGMGYNQLPDRVARIQCPLCSRVIVKIPHKSWAASVILHKRHKCHFKEVGA